MHGMYMGRTILKGRTKLLPKAYFTREAHYSVQILRDLLGLDSVVVKTLPDGGMDPDDLARRLAENTDASALVVATVGTTFKGAIDNIDRVQEKLRSHPSYLHVDAALFGGYLPFTRHAAEISFRKKDASDSGRYDSIAVSCHKFFGFPSPAGLFITTQGLYEEFNALFGRIHNPEYIHHVPGTITCSRDAVKPAEFYHFTTPSARARQVEDATLMLQNAGTGGVFEFAPKVRQTDKDRAVEVYDDVMDGDWSETRREDQEAGTLALFNGNRSLHRVTPIEAGPDRLVLVLSYDSKPGTIFSDDIRMNFFGRTS